jgi:hypothetical protein
VNVAGFLATTLDIADADFDSATNVFNFSGDSTSSVVNAGNINIVNAGTDKGYAVLAGHRVENSGLVQAQLGTVALGSGRAMSLTFSADKLISFVVSDPATAQGSGIANTSNGQLIADGGRVLMTARVASGVAANVINSAGLVQARSVSIKNGEIVLDAGQTGDINVSGTIDARGVATGETGGAITVSGRNIQAAFTSKYLASGRAGGGSITVGLRPVAGAPSSPTTVYASFGSVFDASALDIGNGGRISLLTDYNDAGSFIGANANFYAYGGNNGGVGGTIELLFSRIGFADVNFDAANVLGDAAQLSINSNSIDISASTATGVVGLVPQATVQNLLNAGRRVSINAIGENANSGNILVSSSLTKSTSKDATLILSAKNNIDLLAASTISSTAGTLNVSLLSDQDNIGGGFTRLAGNISITGTSVAAVDGLIGIKYDGYYADNYTFFANAAPQPDPLFASPFTAINTTTPVRALPINNSCKPGDWPQANPPGLIRGSGGNRNGTSLATEPWRGLDKNWIQPALPLRLRDAPLTGWLPKPIGGPD